MDVNSKQMKVAKHFWCEGCRRYWQSAVYVRPEETGIDLPDSDTDDPYNYYAVCEGCGEWTRANRHYYANLSKMHSAQTGPRTEEGKRRSSLNGFKHGLHAKPQHMLAPANGKYDICNDCEIKIDCGAGKVRYCPYKTDLMAKFMAAYENGDIKEMKAFAGLSQARLYMIFETMLAEVMNTGVVVKHPMVSGGAVVEYTDDEGKKHRIDAYDENPLLDKIPKIMTALGMTSDQQTMNPLKADGADDLDGSLKADKSDVHTFMSDMKDLMRIVVGGAPEAAEEMRKRDEVAQALVNDNEIDEDGDVEVPDKIDNPFK